MGLRKITAASVPPKISPTPHSMHFDLAPSFRSQVRRAILFIPCFGLLLALVAAGASTFAASVAGDTGAIAGRVRNAVTGAYLGNARVTVPGTTLLAFTDESGT